MTNHQEDGPSSEDAKQLAAVVQQLVETRDSELEIKRAEMEVQGKEIESNERIAMASIKAQSTFHSQRFNQYNAHLIHRYIFVGLMSLVFVVFTLVAIFLEAGDLVLEIFKLMGPLVIGIFGGYQWGNRASSNKSGTTQPAASPSSDDEES
ncbi:hypothetical protein [Halomonas sp. MS1]|nr:hypothetical protein [Halomonas sp. MS1]UTD55922.1 hypothetical protein NF683_01505 [Halomonas sp. MS1]